MPAVCERFRVLHRHVPIETVLKTPRCRLRYPAPEDAPLIYAALQSPSFPRDVPLSRVKSLEEVEERITRGHHAWVAGRAFIWSIESRAEGTLLGQVTLARRDEADTWALAYWTHPQCWGQGYATEAAGQVIEFGFKRLGADMIWAGAAEWNHASIQVLKKLGMVHVSNNPQGYCIDGEPIPTRDYDIARERWQKLNR